MAFGGWFLRVLWSPLFGALVLWSLPGSLGLPFESSQAAHSGSPSGLVARAPRVLVPSGDSPPVPSKGLAGWPWGLGLGVWLLRGSRRLVLRDPVRSMGLRLGSFKGSLAWPRGLVSRRLAPSWSCSLHGALGLGSFRGGLFGGAGGLIASKGAWLGFLGASGRFLQGAVSWFLQGPWAGGVSAGLGMVGLAGVGGSFGRLGGCRACRPWRSARSVVLRRPLEPAGCGPALAGASVDVASSGRSAVGGSGSCRRRPRAAVARPAPGPPRPIRMDGCAPDLPCRVGDRERGIGSDGVPRRDLRHLRSPP